MKTFAFAALSAATLFAAGALAADSAVLTGKDAFGDYTKDKPGVKRLIQATDLDPPSVTESASNAPGNVPMPEGACLFFHECTHCLRVIRPRPGDCCVFCSYGSRRCGSSKGA